jgi:pyruvate-ferredoxin/flavodoxin oxidoreductase
VPRFFGGSAGLGSRDVRAGDFIAVVENMLSKSPRTYFTLGIKHELALPVTDDPDVRTPGSFSMRGHSVGGYGSVTTNKVIATIAGEVFGMDVQAYPNTDRRRKGCPRPTTSRLRRTTSVFTPNSSMWNSFRSTT